MRALGFPVIGGSEPLFNQLPLDLFPVARRVPFVTCASCTGRDAIANPVGNRDRANWRLHEAAKAAREAVIQWIESGAC